jgi:hypothetical protein
MDPIRGSNHDVADETDDYRSQEAILLNHKTRSLNRSASPSEKLRFYGPPGNGRALYHESRLPSHVSKGVFPYSYPYPGMPPIAPWYFPPSPTASGSPSVTSGSNGSVQDEFDPGIEAINALLIDQKKRKRGGNLAEYYAESRAAAAAKLKVEEEKLLNLQNLIIEHNKQQLEREKRRSAERASMIAAAEVEDKKGIEFEAAATQTWGRAEAEEEVRKKGELEIAEAKRMDADLRTIKRGGEEEAKPFTNDMLRAPIYFRDAVGRKFTFPWHLCESRKVRLQSIPT